MNVTRRTVLQKVRRRTHMVLRQFVNTGFQVLFHSPPGVLFTFPSRYCTLSVTEEYLALRSGLRSFTQDTTCLVLLWILLCFTFLSRTGLSPSLAGLSRTVLLGSLLQCRSPNPMVLAPWFGLFRVRSPLLTESFLFSLPPAT